MGVLLVQDVLDVLLVVLIVLLDVELDVLELVVVHVMGVSDVIHHAPDVLDHVVEHVKIVVVQLVHHNV